MSAPVPAVSPELKALMRKLKLGRMNDTLPERLALAKSHGLSHAEFLEQLFSDEATRRDAESAGRRARAAHLDPHMVLEAWDDDANVAYDRAIWSELVSMRFVDQARNAFILGPVGVGKTFMATALGHIAYRRRISVHFERAEKLHKRLKAARLDASHDAEMRKLIGVDLLIVDDFALSSLGAAETADVYELVVERHRSAATVVTSNTDPVEWLGVMADPLLAQSAVDRMKSAAWELVIENPAKSPPPRPPRRPRRPSRDWARTATRLRSDPGDHVPDLRQKAAALQSSRVLLRLQARDRRPAPPLPAVRNDRRLLGEGALRPLPPPLPQARRVVHRLPRVGGDPDEQVAVRGVPGLEASPPHHRRLLQLWTRSHARRRGLVPALPPATTAAGRRPADSGPYRLAPAVLRRHVSTGEALRAPHAAQRAQERAGEARDQTGPAGPTTDAVRPPTPRPPTGARSAMLALRAATGEGGVGDHCHACTPGGPVTPPPCRRCGSTTDYYSAGQRARCHKYAPVGVGACVDCLAWEATRTNGWRCEGCRGWRKNHRIGTCVGCGRRISVGPRGACRLCYLDAARRRPRDGPWEFTTRYGQQLAFADMRKNAGRRRQGGRPTPARPFGHYPATHRQGVLFTVAIDLVAGHEPGSPSPKTPSSCAFSTATSRTTRTSTAAG